MAILAAGLLASGSLALAGLDGLGANAASACGPGVELRQCPPGPIACVHEDLPPPGVDPTEHVSTRELLSRERAGPTAYEAAEELIVPTTAAAGATSPVVPCDGDGTSGFRVWAWVGARDTAPTHLPAGVPRDEVSAGAARTGATPR